MIALKTHIMQETFTHNKTYDKVDFKLNPIPKGEYEKCVFTQCDLSGTNLSGIKFIDCIFTDCNLSLANLTKTSFQEAVFKDCKMLGMRFDNCNKFMLSVAFENCTLNHSSFYNTKINKTKFKHCQLQECDFTGADLSATLFDTCDLASATFESTILEKADLRTSFNYSINPAINGIKKAKFSLYGLPGLLDKYDIDIENT